MSTAWTRGQRPATSDELAERRLRLSRVPATMPLPDEQAPIPAKAVNALLTAKQRPLCDRHRSRMFVDYFTGNGGLYFWQCPITNCLHRRPIDREKLLAWVMR